MSSVILSIKPMFAELIYTGAKRIELRRIMPRKLEAG
jgi:predicted transcriptional regulator